MQFLAPKSQCAAERPPDPADEKWAQFADHVARYAFAMDYAKGRTVLDAGAGLGYGAAMLRAGGAARVVAVDIDPNVIAEAQSRYGDGGIEFLADDCQSLTKAVGPFDLICSFENIEHLPQPEQFLKAAASRLAPNGLLIISTPDRAATEPFVNGRPVNPYHFHEWYRDEFMELLGRYFSRCELRVQVKSNALERRTQAAEALVRHLKRNPLARLTGIAKFALRRRSYWAPIRDLATPSPTDCPIVDPAVAIFFGRPWCHVVLCRV